MSIGVYRDLISTLRHADTSIPVLLGNLRQEIEAEKAFLRYRVREGDRYSVFPRSFRKHRRKRRQVVQLLSLTIENLWQDFKNLERPFLIKNAFRAEEVRSGDYWGESDIDEKKRPQLDKVDEMQTHDRSGLAEAGAIQTQENYYRTDLVHRFIWWKSRTAVNDMLQQVQRIQIRRIERDVFETDELVKLCLKILDRKSGGGGHRGKVHGGSDSGSDGSGDGSAGPQRCSVRSRAGSVPLPSRRGSRSERPSGKVEEGDFIRVRPENIRRNIGYRKERNSGPRHEVDVPQAGRIYVQERQERRYRSRERD